MFDLDILLFLLHVYALFIRVIFKRLIFNCDTLRITRLSEKFLSFYKEIMDAQYFSF